MGGTGVAGVRLRLQAACLHAAEHERRRPDGVNGCPHAGQVRVVTLSSCCGGCRVGGSGAAARRIRPRAARPAPGQACAA